MQRTFVIIWPIVTGEVAGYCACSLYSIIWPFIYLYSPFVGLIVLKLRFISMLHSSAKRPKPNRDNALQCSRTGYSVFF